MNHFVARNFQFFFNLTDIFNSNQTDNLNSKFKFKLGKYVKILEF